MRKTQFIFLNCIGSLIFFVCTHSNKNQQGLVEPVQGISQIWKDNLTKPWNLMESKVLLREENKGTKRYRGPILWS